LSKQYLLHAKSHRSDAVAFFSPLYLQRVFDIDSVFDHRANDLSEMSHVTMSNPFLTCLSTWCAKK
jgi:hypothetical protein